MMEQNVEQQQQLKDRVDSSQCPQKKTEERYVKMRKGEVSFTSSKRKKEHTSVVSMDDDRPSPSTTGLGLQMEKALSPLSSLAGQHSSSLSFHQQRHNLDGQLYTRMKTSNTHNTMAGGSSPEGGMSMAAAIAMDMDRPVDLHQSQLSLQNGHPFSVLAGFRGRDSSYPLPSSAADEDDDKSIPSSVLVGTHTTPGLSRYLQPLPKSTQGSPSMSLAKSSSASNLASLFPRESSPYLGSPTMGRKQQSQVLGI